MVCNALNIIARVRSVSSHAMKMNIIMFRGIQDVFGEKIFFSVSVKEIYSA